MADIAHDASGPASPKPEEIAPQQASRPDAPDRGKLRVFISYSGVRPAMAADRAVRGPPSRSPRQERDS